MVYEGKNREMFRKLDSAESLQGVPVTSGNSVHCDQTSTFIKGEVIPLLFVNP